MPRIHDFLARERLATACVVVDLDVVRERYLALRHLLPDAHIYYAVKANPAGDVIAALATQDIGFDLASSGEIDRCRALGIDTRRFCFSNTIKRERDITWARALGIDLFAFDSPAELDKLARGALGARVFRRIAVHSSGVEWPRTRKFGCTQHLAAELLLRAQSCGLVPVGVSFHVGSQLKPRKWPRPVPAGS